MRPLRLLSIVLALVVVGATTPAAHAGRQTTRDASRDVIRFRFADGQVTQVRDDRVHDIVRAGTVYRGRALVLWLQVRRLADVPFTATWDVKTPGSRWALHYDRRVRPAYTSLFHGNVEVLDCAGLRGRELPRSDRVKVTVPRSCIGSPRWIRFGASMGEERPHVAFIDDARLDAGFLATACKLGPRVRHN